MSYYPRIHSIVCDHFNIINPQFVSAEVGDVGSSTIRMVLDRAVTSTSTVVLSDFVLDVTGGAVTVSSITTDGVNVDLSLSRAVVFGEAGTILFTPTTTKLYIAGDGYLRSFTSKTITNNVGETTTDIDGNIYDVITIGTQQWLGQSLKTTKYKDGSPITNVTNSVTWGGLTTEAYCWYNNDIANKDVYGALYNWHVVNDVRGLAPEGYHIATAEEFITLSTFLGGDSVAGGKLKEVGNAHWAGVNVGATDEVGFTALPAGYRTYDVGTTFLGITSTNSLWTATFIPNFPRYRYLLTNNAGFIESGILKGYGLSIRCIKD